MSQLPLMEHFYTLQGEGAYSGYAAYFLRLGGCDVGCVWCDVKESWDASKHPLTGVSDMLQWVKQSGANRVVVTGGEPLLHNLTELCQAFQEAGILLHIETSGSSAMSGTWDWICVSPKKFKAPLPQVLQLAHELKVVVFNKSDFAWAEQQAKHVSANCRLFLQPEWDKSHELMPAILAYIKANPRWQLSLQTHKYLNIP